MNDNLIRLRHIGRSLNLEQKFNHNLNRRINNSYNLITEIIEKSEITSSEIQKISIKKSLNQVKQITTTIQQNNDHEDSVKNEQLTDLVSIFKVLKYNSKQRNINKKNRFSSDRIETTLKKMQISLSSNDFIDDTIWQFYITTSTRWILYICRT